MNVVGQDADGVYSPGAVVPAKHLIHNKATFGAVQRRYGSHS